MGGLPLAVALPTIGSLRKGSADHCGAPSPRLHPRPHIWSSLLNTTGGPIVDFVTVTVNPLPAADAGPGASICQGESTRLRASGGASYRWSPAVNLSCVDCAEPIAQPLVSTLYTVTVVSEFGCSRATDTVRVTVFNYPTVNAGADTSICLGGTATLHASGGTAWSWTPAVGLSCTDCPAPAVSPTATTTYHVTVTGTGGCTAADSVTVNVIPPPLVDAGRDTSSCLGDPVQLRAVGAVGYAWEPSDALSCLTAPIRSFAPRPVLLIS